MKLTKVTEKVSPEILSRYRQSINAITAKRYRILILCGTVLFMGYSYVDRMIYPEYQIEFLLMRIIVCAFFILSYFPTYSKRVQKRIPWLVDVGLLGPLLGIAFIIYRTNGVESEYYTGISLVLMALFIANSFYWRHNFTVGILTMGAYAAAAFFNPTPWDNVKYLYANYIIGTTVFFVTLMTWLFEREYFYGFVRNEKLRESEARLEEANNKLAAMYRQADEISKIDDLTKIYNRRHFFEVLEDKLRSCRERSTFFYLVIFDIDRFKDINDNYGHFVGDKALQHVAQAVCDNVRPKSYVGRYGGDEFLIIIDKAERDVFLARISAIKKAVENTPFSHGDRPIKISISIGAVRVDPEKTADAAKAIEGADRALIAIKQSARGEINLID